jgi:TolB-like protein/lipoprotein NlpI
MGLISELRRRNVLRMAVLYAIAAWLIMQVTEVLMSVVGLPAWAGRATFAVLAVGFPIALIFSWFYEITPEGISLEKDVDPAESITHVTGRRLDFIVISLLCAAVVLFAYDKWWMGGPPEQSIAVLPFENMSGDPDQEYFSDGISEELLNLLAQIPELMVISRSSAFSFKDKDIAIPTVAKQLNVAHVLEGSVRKVGNRVRITAQLIEARSDTHLWSKSYDRTLDDIFAIQDEIAADVVDALKITLLGKEPKATETNPEAYALYLQGRYFINQGTEESIKKAETLLKQALAMDSQSAPAWTELASVYITQGGYYRPVNEAYELARDAVQQALAIDPQYARAYAELAWVEMFYERDFAAARQHQQRALALSPGDATSLEVAASLNTKIGHLDEAIDLYRQSIALDPVSPNQHLFLGRAFYFAHRLDEAADSLQMALSLSPGRIGGQYYVGWVLLAQGDVQAALLAMEQERHDGYRLTGTAVVQHALGDAAASDAALAELIEKHGEPAAYQIAMAYAFRGEINNAFDWLERAYDNGDTGLAHMLVDPVVANLHNDSRWEPFLDKMGLPH